MADDAATRARRYRESRRGGPARELAPCGTPTARKRHKYRDDEDCLTCYPEGSHARKLRARRLGEEAS